MKEIDSKKTESERMTKNIKTPPSMNNPQNPTQNAHKPQQEVKERHRGRCMQDRKIGP